MHTARERSTQLNTLSSPDTRLLNYSSATLARKSQQPTQHFLPGGRWPRAPLCLSCPNKSTRIADQKTVNYFESPGKKDTKKVKKNESKKQEVLANPLRKSAIPSPFESDSSASVFFNPFHKAQEDKKTVLEKHVKMTENPKDVLEINGKKICWNYRKGRCKFGHNCKYAHDSDISKPSDSKDMQNATGTVLHGDTLATQVPVTDAVIDELSTKKKKRPGLSDGIVPSKKVQKFHRKQQSKETPWLLKR